MPKASASTGRTALRRNQACLSCRKRKLKCDAARPHCSTCVKQWQALISVPPPVGYAHPTEPQCSYDPVEGLPIAPDTDPTERIRLLEEHISQLRNQLNETRHFRSGSASPPQRRASSNQHISSSASVGSSGRSPTLSSPNGGSSVVSPTLEIASGVSMESPVSQLRGSSGSPQTLQSGGSRGNDPIMMDVLFSGWDPDLPDPEVLNHYIEVFFRCDPCGSRVLHRPSFLASMHLHPKDLGFPHSAVLHAICASASRWASHDIITMPDGTRRDRFAEFHVSKTRSYIDRTMASGQDIFPVMQACIILSWYFYQEGRWVEVWIFAGFQTRVAVPLRLNYPGTFSAAQGGSSPGAYLAPPKDFKELESRRRTWWMTIMFDRIVSVGGWLHGVDERDVGTEFPLRSIDFEQDSNIASNPQDLATKDVFVRHISAYTDSFLLFLKAVMLFGRVTDHNTRTNLRAPQLKSQNPFSLPGFEELDRLVCIEFLQCIPTSFKHLGLGEGGALDTDLYMVHIVPHAATITLHNSYIDFKDSQSVSTSRCLHATRSILAAYYSLSETSLDISRLHPFVTICWYLAAVVQIQLCKYFIEINDTARESTVWGEINVLRFAMLEYGNRSPIGTRQEKLLQGLMTEIVRMTTQMHPLEMGVPLYPFSHSGVFPINKGGSGGESAGAPLPDSTPYDEQTSGSPTSLRGAMHTPSMSFQRQQHDQASMGWHSRPSTSSTVSSTSARTYMTPNMHPSHSQYSP
ncbi:uncharacterized protein PHACADRAFT_247554 [Phanerochaete carnosa HHB-10118-sp]|uniref:Zn(2)-C6 fungal-type domain-containing protein n=1 Tax=Phanerochaete carnosa (strain HHB-10118-sp) TaxID=650164 RepID=K5WB11_PHACS|nr:uncharacterized protein PHACADRAFT_247554 [Phanerochaete carnosa HHB-10118-sp]EKM61148.1 hypothetical protein PHACADRAFT_247554 [Phanerochaete carnosa HHB-10118-sp]